jgi:hypothetical protein
MKEVRAFKVKVMPLIQRMKKHRRITKQIPGIKVPVVHLNKPIGTKTATAGIPQAVLIVTSRTSAIPRKIFHMKTIRIQKTGTR